jgi:hypothetical protein
MENKLSVTDVFHWNYESNARIKINQGGTYSGKTYAILQVIFMRLLEKKRIATVVGQDIPNLKKGPCVTSKSASFQNTNGCRTLYYPTMPQSESTPSEMVRC